MRWWKGIKGLWLGIGRPCRIVECVGYTYLPGESGERGWLGQQPPAAHMPYRIVECVLLAVQSCRIVGIRDSDL